MKRLLLLLVLLLLATGCDSSDPDPEPLAARVVVASQGNFSEATGGLTLYDTETGETREVYGGLFIQTIAQHDGRLFVASNDRVDVLDPATFDRTGRFTDVPNPRYFAFGDGEAFVTNAYTDPMTFGDGGVTRLDLGAGTTGETVVLGGNPDGIARAGNRLYVANYDYGASRTVTVLDPETLDEIERIDVGCDGPRFLLRDAQDEVLVVCTGNPFGAPATAGAFVVLDAATGDERARVNLPTTLEVASGGRSAVYVPQREEVYALDEASRTVYRFDTATNTLDATLDVGGAPLSAVAYDVVTDRLYLGRLHPDQPYTDAGTVTLHDRTGTEVGRFSAGIIPTDILILEH